MTTKAAASTAPELIRVVIADDQALVRAGFRALLDAQPDLTVVAEAADGAEAVARAVEHRPHVVLMDIRMPGLDGLAATRRIAADPRLADVKVIILTTFDLDEYVFEALRAGATGFLVKDTEPVELLRAQQHRDRRPSGDQRRHGQDPREPGHDQARRPRPGPARGLRLRGGARPARLAGLSRHRRRPRRTWRTFGQQATKGPPSSFVVHFWSAPPRDLRPSA